MPVKKDLASFCKTLHIRPSAVFEWNDPDEWMERYKFDLEVMSYLGGA